MLNPIFRILEQCFFFRFLLDSLHEQEKRSLGLTGLTAIPRDHRIKRSSDLEDDPVSDPELGSVKPASSSNALDAISEAPEDEDMISQVGLMIFLK